MIVSDCSIAMNTLLGESMKIADVQVIRFSVEAEDYGTKWGYGQRGPKRRVPRGLIKITTDDGQSGFDTQYGWDGYYEPPSVEETENIIKPLLVGEDPRNIEKLWQWMMAHRGFSETTIGSIDCALWDLMGKLANSPTYQVLGGARDKVKAYASTYPNLGNPDVYAKHAKEAVARGYKAFKVHAYIFWDPINDCPAPGKPAFPKQDIEVCEAVRDAVGNDIVLMLDPWSVYTYQESLMVGRQLEKLDYYWLEHPMDERRMEPYKQLTKELDINILGPEMEPGSFYTRANWAFQRASDMGRIDVSFGGITGCRKAIAMYESLGMQCEMHVGGFANLAILGSTTEEQCEYYERGLTKPDEDRDACPVFLKKPCDPLDNDGYVKIPKGPGLGIEFNWDYIEDNFLPDLSSKNINFIG